MQLRSRVAANRSDRKLATDGSVYFLRPRQPLHQLHLKIANRYP